MTIPELERLRQSIDDVDQQILDLIRERVRLVLEVGDLKRERDMQVYDPEREQQLLDRLAAQAKPPLDGETVARVFQRLVEESRRLEQEHMRRG